MPVPASDSISGNNQRLNLYTRVVLLAALLFCEKLALNFLVDFDSAQASTGFGAVVRVAQHLSFRLLVSFAVALALFAYVRDDARLAAVNTEVRAVPLRLRWLWLHLLCLLALLPLSYSLYGDRGLALPFALLVALWLVCALGALLSAAAAVVPWQQWRRAALALGRVWLYAALAAIISAGAMQLSQKLWTPTARLTFQLVTALLSPLIPSLQSDPSTLIMSSDRFSVQVSEECSGLEGVGLMLAFCSAWLLLFRREYIFPRSLLLIPAGLLLIFALNVVRIAALMLIGHAGYAQIAIYGFHSQAGWIAFNIAAVSIAILSRRSRWFNRALPLPGERIRSDNPTAAFLLPFLAILAAGIIAHASSAGFETPYVLRLIAGGIAIACYWPTLRRLDWRCSWRGPAIGVLVFALWMLAAHWLLAPSAIPGQLAAMSSGARTFWLVTRIVAAVVTVPIAEELAYRGYLMRRLQSVEFETLPFQQVRWRAVLVSSLVFGVMHGALWPAAVVTGIVYARLLTGTGRIGEAVMAHATTNALLALMVVSGNQWQLW